MILIFSSAGSFCFADNQTQTREIVEISSDSLVKNPQLRKRLIAAGLTITLGHFGMHRLYLGTKPVVVAFYALTLGGGLGILPLVDLVCILTTKDLTRYMNNDKVFMWSDPIK